jgi:hypothetical protein
MLPMKYRRLRIAFATVCPVPCVLMIALWVRSYFCRDGVTILTPIQQRGNQCTNIQTFPGVLSIGSASQLGGPAIYHIEYWGRSETRHNDAYYSLLPIHRPKVIFGHMVRFWFLVLITGAFAAVAWWKRGISFSLRTLLIGMTIVSALLGLLIWAMNRPWRI